MASYRRKSSLVTAKQWKFGDPPLDGMLFNEHLDCHFLKVHKSRVRVYDTNWIVTFPEKIRVVMTDEDFKKEYELVTPDRPEFKVYDTLFERIVNIDTLVAKETWANKELMIGQDIQWSLTEEGVLFLIDEDGNCAYYLDDDERFNVRFAR